jgi:hypothetical protein
MNYNSSYNQRELVKKMMMMSVKRECPRFLTTKVKVSSDLKLISHYSHFLTFHLFRSEHSVSLSSHDGYEGRPELLGQSNGESESRVQPDAGSPTRVEADHRQETRLIELGEPASERSRETSSQARDRSSDDRDRPSNDQEGMSSLDM